MSSRANFPLCSPKKKNVKNIERGARVANSRDKERAVRGIIPFPEFDDAPPGLVPGPGAPPMIKGDAGERGTRVGSGERWCGASISNFLFPYELACVENVTCNVATHTRERKRELHTLSTQTPGREEKKMTVERGDGRGRR